MIDTFLFQPIFDGKSNKVSQEALAKDKRTLFSKTSLAEKSEYDVVLLTSFVSLVSEGIITDSTHFNVNVETIDTHFNEIVEQLSRVTTKTSLVTFELLENCYSQEECMIPLRTKRKIAELKNMFDISYSLDDIPNFSSHNINYGMIEIEEVKFDVKHVADIYKNRNSVKGKRFLDSALSYTQDIRAEQAVIEGIETLEMFSYFREELEPIFLDAGIKMFFQGYGLGMPANYLQSKNNK